MAEAGKARTTHALLDRFTEDKAVLYAGDEEDVKLVVPASFMPADAEEGTVLAITIACDDAATAAAMAEAEELLRDVRAQNA